MTADPTDDLARLARESVRATEEAMRLVRAVDDAVRNRVATGADAHRIAVALGVTLDTARDIVDGRLRFSELVWASTQADSLPSEEEAERRRRAFAAARRDPGEAS
ncbi:hypothetical protein [Microbacterium sp. gxy059]|uniref:hypothetical protein n=1 Tax=Microbacterium sp. gxy059 TaxID=2957199 RepID=UPI003D986CEF